MPQDCKCDIHQHENFKFQIIMTSWFWGIVQACVVSLLQYKPLQWNC